MSVKKAANEDRLKYNWSGHVTMDTATNGFFKENMHKAESIEVRFRHGLLPVKARRNPLVAERSPRQKVKAFDFSVPPKQAEESRWHYPEADLGILAKFPSQKEQFDLQHEKERIYDENVKRLEIIKAQREAEMAAEQAKHVARLNGPEATSSARSSAKPGLIDAMSRYDDEGPWKTNTLESTNNFETSAQKKSTKQKKTFYEQPISTFKNLGAQNPDMLASWRAKRAADFINQQGNPLEPPANLDMDGLEPFRPAGGTLTLKRSTKKFGSSLGGSGSLPALEDALKATNAAIAKQQLKLLQSRK